MSNARILARVILCAGLVAAAGPAAAERLVVSLSNHRVMVTSSFAGEELVLFGSVEQDRASVLRRGGYDLVVTVRGPRQSVRARHKERVLGIWVNVESRIFVGVPSYLAVLSNKPVNEITNAETLRREQIGIENYLLPQQIGADIGDVVRNDPFRAAFIRLKKEHGLYLEDSKAITFLTPTLFRAAIPLPAAVPVGSYTIDIKLFAEGALITRASSALEIVKVGFEQFVANAARDHGLLYGLATVALALVTGWIGAVVFRRD
jgi:uncharacterized protein (TIGR02186 family)